MYAIGEFSKLTKLSIPTLRYYDSIGILKPELKKSENNYRYYTTKQLMKAQLIHDMRAVNFSLEEIRQILECDKISSKQAAIETIYRRNEEQCFVIKRLSEYYALGSRLLDEVKGGQDKKRVIEISEFSQGAYVSSRSTFVFNDPDDFIAQSMKLQHKCDKSGLYRYGNLIAICRDGVLPPPEDDRNSYDIEFRISVHAGIDSDDDFVEHDEPQRVASITTSGEIEEASQACSFIEEWIQKSPYVQVGDPIVEYILEPCDTMSYTDFPVKIHIPIE